MLGWSCCIDHATSNLLWSGESGESFTARLFRHVQHRDNHTMDIEQAREIARKYHPPLTQCPKAMQKALGVTPAQRKHVKRKRRQPRRRPYKPRRRDVERCINQRHGVVIDD